jgi:hypothetical protein
MCILAVRVFVRCSVRAPTEAEKILWANPVYVALKAAGMTVVQHMDDPTLGWVATLSVGQYGPFHTSEQAITAAVTALCCAVAEVVS